MSTVMNSSQMRSLTTWKTATDKRAGDAVEILKDLWLFIKERKKFWLAPIIVILLLLGLLIVFGAGSAIAPFIYTLF